MKKTACSDRRADRLRRRSCNKNDGFPEPAGAAGSCGDAGSCRFGDAGGGGMGAGFRSGRRIWRPAPLSGPRYPTAAVLSLFGTASSHRTLIFS